MPNTLPYYPMYPRDFDTDGMVRAMEDSELGLYIRCLNYSWVNDGLPADPEEIRRAFRDTPEAFAQKWPRVEPCFPPGEDGRRRNPRLEKERAQAIEKSSKASANAKRSHSGRTADGQQAQQAQQSERSARASESVSVSDSPSESESVEGESAERGLQPSVAPILAELEEIYKAAGAPIPEKHLQTAAQLLISIEPEKRMRVPAYCKWALWSDKWPNPGKTKALVNVLRDGDWDVELTPRTLPDAPVSRPPSKAEAAHDEARRRFLGGGL
jgi:uncharacterized protein YdaU (DUF1376 family)